MTHVGRLTTSLIASAGDTGIWYVVYYFSQGWGWHLALLTGLGCVLLHVHSTATEAIIMIITHSHLTTQTVRVQNIAPCWHNTVI